jgi:glutathione S-transferase
MPAWGLPDISVFCVKAETYLRMAGFEYRTAIADPRKAPKGKLPFIEHDGVVVCDSSAIVTYLERLAPHPLDASLTPREKAISTAFKGLFEEQLYFVVLHQRWIDPAGWNTYRPVLAALARQYGVPSFLIPLIAASARAKIRRTVWMQGTGRHAPEEIDAMGVSLLSAVSDWLEDRSFMLGEEPHAIDATAYGFLASVLWAPFEGPLKTHAHRLGNLVAYSERMKARYWD